MLEYWPHITVLGTVNVLVLLVVIPYVLLTKKEPATAVAWVLELVSGLLRRFSQSHPDLERPAVLPR